MVPSGQGQTNWLFRGMVGFSIGIHILVFFHAAGIYQSRTLSYIELTLHQYSIPVARHIPSPASRQVPPPISGSGTSVPEKIATPVPQVYGFHTPTLSADQLRPVYDNIRIPDLPVSRDTGVTEQQQMAETAGPFAPSDEPRVEDQPGQVDAQTYFGILNQRIQDVKKYPGSARARNLEGRVIVEFALRADGTLSKARVVKSSGHVSLDKAAVKAVRDAAPFPNPPASLFKGSITLRVGILFELV